MSQLPETPSPIPPKRIDLTSDPTVGWRILAYDTIAVLFWAYTVTTLFVFDAPRFIFEKYAPDSVWLLEFKLIFFFGVAAFAAIFAKRLRLIGWLFYIIAFPLVLIFWKIPKNVLKTGSLNLIFYFMFTTLGFFKSIKYNVLVTFLVLLSSAIALFGTSPSLLYAASIMLIVLIFVILFNRVVSILRPSDTFVLFSKVTSWWQTYTIKKVQEDTQAPQLSLLAFDDSSREAVVANAEFALISNRAILYSAKSLRDYQNSGIAAVSGIFITVFLFILMTLFFSLIYWAAYKVDTTNFTYNNTPGAFAFFALSFKGMFFTGINELNPATPLAQSINILQNFVALFIVVIFVSIIFTSRNQVISYQLEETIKRVRDDGHAIERAMFGRYQINSIDELMSELRRLKASGVKIAEFLSKKL